MSIIDHSKNKSVLLVDKRLKNILMININYGRNILCSMKLLNIFLFRYYCEKETYNPFYL